MRASSRVEGNRDRMVHTEARRGRVMRGLMRLGLASAAACAGLLAPRVASAVGPDSLQLPPAAVPSISSGDGLIVYVHGGPGSRLEESSDLVPALIAEGLKHGKKYTVVSFDQPTQGYSSMHDHTLVHSDDNKLWDNSIVNHDKTKYPIMDFSEEFVVDFLEQLDKDTHGTALRQGRVHHRRQHRRGHHPSHGAPHGPPVAQEDRRVERRLHVDDLPWGRAQEPRARYGEGALARRAAARLVPA